MSSDILKKSWPYVAIILAHIIWGLNFLVAKLTLAEFPPMTLAFLRFFLATLLLVPFLLAEKKIKIEKVDLPKLICIGILMASLNIAFFYMGLSRTTVIDASVLTMVIPIISVLGGWVILREKVYSANLIGIILGLGGTIAVIGIPLLFLGVQISASMMLGNFLIILASVSWVSGAILSKTICNYYHCNFSDRGRYFFNPGPFGIFTKPRLDFSSHLSWNFRAGLYHHRGLNLFLFPV